MSQIEQAFGQEPLFAGRDLSHQEQQALSLLFGEQGYQHYLQDQINRHIIRDYLANAMFRGVINEERLPDLSMHLGTRDGRSTLALHMLVHAVEDADELLKISASGELSQLKPSTDSPPNMKLVHVKPKY